LRDKAVAPDVHSADLVCADNMTNRNYDRGVEKERKAQEQLEAVGYETMRTAGSHGLFDVIGYGATGVRCIQVKRAKQDQDWRPEYEQAKEKLESLPDITGVSREVWVWVDYQKWVKQEVI